MQYKREIVALLNKIHNGAILRYLYIIINDIVNESEVENVQISKNQNSN